jgi:predicted amidohydrolase YtcJ
MIVRLFVSLLAIVFASVSASAKYADIIFINGEIYTVDAKRSWAEAVSIKGNRIVQVGTVKEAMTLLGDRTRIVDLNGKMMLPGFQDVHVHPIEAGMGYLGCSLHEGKSADDYAKLVAQCAAKQITASFIEGAGWTMDQFPGGLPDKKLLDAVEPDRPVILKSATGHQLWSNSAALDLAGVDAETPDPVGGRIDRYPGSKEPSGSVQENSAMNLIFAARPHYTESQMFEALAFGQRYLNQYGVTTVQDALLKLDGKEAYVGGPTYMAFDQSGKLTLRVVGALVWNTQLGLEQIDRIIDARERFNSPRFSAPSVKIWLDGVIEVHTAALLAPYLDRSDGYKGELLINPKLLNEIVARLDSLGFQIHFHAIGDAAIRSSLDSLEFALNKNGVRDSRHHLSHIQLFDPSDIKRFRNLKAIANFQPYWAWADRFITELTIPKLGSQRSRWLYPIASLVNSGATVAFGSDWFVTSGNPMLGIETAITRRDPLSNDGPAFHDQERIRLHEAIAAYTINGAYVNFLDDELGSIEAGKLADLIVIDRNLFNIPPQEISEAQVLLTLLDGEPVYGNWDLEAQPKTAP